MSDSSDPFAAGHSRRCAVCGESPVVKLTGLCGPCTFGGAEQAAAVWNPTRRSAEVTSPTPPMTRDQALLTLGRELPDGAFASVHPSEVALANRDVAADLSAGRVARVHREWSVLVTAPGYQRNHAGDELRPVVEQALADFAMHRTAREAADWVAAAVPDKPPRLTAPTTAESAHVRGRDKGAG